MTIKGLSKNCPARCKHSDKCYGRAYFLAKPGKSKKCDGKCKFVTKNQKDK